MYEKYNCYLISNPIFRFDKRLKKMYKRYSVTSNYLKDVAVNAVVLTDDMIIHDYVLGMITKYTMLLGLDLYYGLTRVEKDQQKFIKERVDCIERY